MAERASKGFISTWGTAELLDILVVDSILITYVVPVFIVGQIVERINCQEI